MPEFDRGGTRQGPSVIAGDRGVGQQPEQRSDALAAVRALAVERQVVADHLVEPVRRRVAVLDEPDDLAFGIGDELREVEIRRCGRHVGESTPKRVPRK